LSKVLADDVLDAPAAGPIRKTRVDLLSELRKKGKGGYDLEITIGDQVFALPCIYPKDTTQIHNFPRLAGEFAKRMEDVISLPKAFKDILKIREMDASDFVNAFALHYWSDPNQEGGRLDELQALEMVAYSPGAFNGLVNVIEAGMVDGMKLSVSQKVLDAKKD
jgi:hypothetical protein